jgi:hypothetical protein
MNPRTSFSRIFLVVIIIATTLFTVGWMKGENAEKRTWEYKYQVVGAAQTQQVVTMLNQQGADGWELVQVDREEPGSLIHFYFKRAK